MRIGCIAGIDGTIYMVDTIDDVVADDGQLSLREAITAANTNSPFNEAPAGSDSETDIIFFDTYFSFSALAVQLDSTISVTDDLYIEGSAALPVYINSSTSCGVFYVEPYVNLQLYGMSLTGWDSAIYNDGGTVEMYYSSITDSRNSSGGAIYNNGGNILAFECDFISNKTTSREGGAIYCVDGQVDLQRCYFEGNYAYDYYENDTGKGGAIYCETSDVYIDYCSFYANESRDDGGAIYMYAACFAEISNSEFIDNTSDESGGAICMEYHCNASIINSDLCNNVAENEGGAIYFNITDMDISHCQLKDNFSIYLGGAIAGGIHGGDIEIDNSLICGNISNNSGGGLGLRMGSLTATNTTIAGNCAESGGGIKASSTITLNNSIVCANAEFREWSGRYDGVDNINSSIQPVLNNSLIDTDACFVVTPSFGEDEILGTEDDVAGDFHLSPYSKAINGGNNDFVVERDGIYGDIEGNPRIKWDIVDAGAFEYQDEYIPDIEDPSSVANTLEDVVCLDDGLISVREALSYMELTGTSFELSPSLMGGTLVLQHGPLEVNRSVQFDCWQNEAITIDANGSPHAIVVENSDIELAMFNVVITDSSGSAIDFKGRLLWIEGCSLIRNGSQDCNGGAVAFGESDFAEEQYLNILDSFINGNKGALGGGVYFAASDAEVYMINSVFVGNASSLDGGAVYLSDTHVDAPVNPSVLARLTNCTLVENTSESSGGGLYAYHVLPLINNTILSMNDAGLEFDQVNSGQLNTSFIGGDPLFDVYPYIGDDSQWGTADDYYGDLHLQQASPAFDAGDSSLAKNGNNGNLSEDITGITPRNLGVSVDIGAYETVPVIIPESKADFDGDHDVDIFDFLILKSNFGSSSVATKEMGDADCDGDVDIFDFLILKADYGKTY